MYPDFGQLEEHEHVSRTPFLAAMSVLIIFVAGVMALVISLAFSIRPSASSRPSLSHNVVAPARLAPLPAPRAPAPRSHLCRLRRQRPLRACARTGASARPDTGSRSRARAPCAARRRSLRRFFPGCYRRCSARRAPAARPVGSRRRGLGPRRRSRLGPRRWWLGPRRRRLGPRRPRPLVTSAIRRSTDSRRVRLSVMS